MRSNVTRIVLSAAALGLGALGFAPCTAGQADAWETEIRSFEQSDRVAPPRAGVIVFTGSSSIRLWDTLGDNMKPLDVINRGFGGSQIDEVNRYVPRIVLPYRPRAVVLYCGDNDLAEANKKSAETVLADLQRFVQIVHGAMPETWIYYISIKPSTQRWSRWPEMRRANSLIAIFAQTQERVQFIDVSSAMLDSAGKPRPDLLKEDGLHPNAKCYQLWTSIIKPVLMQRFGAAVTSALPAPDRSSRPYVPSGAKASLPSAFSGTLGLACHSGQAKNRSRALPCSPLATDYRLLTTDHGF
jgi:lysophospholipase L1-like esterase